MGSEERLVWAAIGRFGASLCAWHNPDVRTSFMYANSPRLRRDRVDDGVLGGALWREIMAAEVAMRAKQGDVRRHI